MKTILTILLFTFSLNFSNAQVDGIIVNEILEHMSKGEKTGFEVAILDAEVKDVQKQWKKFMKRNKAKTKKSKKSVELFTDNAKLTKLSDNTIDVYAIATKAEYGVKLKVFFDLGGEFISSQYHQKAFGAAENLLREFVINQSIIVVDSELKTQKNELKNISKDLKNLVSDKASYQKEIEKAKALIAQRERDIINNEAAQETKRQQIIIQEEIVKTIKQKRKELDY